MDEKDKFDGTEKIEEEEENVYIARHAKKDEEDRFADIENFDVDNTEAVENKAQRILMFTAIITAMILTVNR